MGQFTFESPKTFFRKVDIRKFLLAIPGLEDDEQRTLYNELLKFYTDDHILSRDEICLVLKSLLYQKKIDREAVLSVLKTFYISHDFFDQITWHDKKLEMVDPKDKDYFKKNDIINNLFDIVTMTAEQKELVIQTLILEYQDDERLDKNEILQTVKNLYLLNKIEKKHAGLILTRFGIDKFKLIEED